MEAFGRRIHDAYLLGLIEEIVGSFRTAPGKGLPLGNLTSQLFANVYLDALDKFVKHRLKIRHYIRYADDFVLLHYDRNILIAALDLIRAYLFDELKLDLHPEKVELRTIVSGVDFLGWVHFSDHRILRPATARRVRRALDTSPDCAALAAYDGLCVYGNAFWLQQEIEKTRSSAGVY